MSKKTIKVKSVSGVSVKRTTPLDILGTFIYHYPQYTLEQARKMPYRTIVKLLQIANKQQTIKYIHLLQINASAQSEKSYKSLHKSYREQINE